MRARTYITRVSAKPVVAQVSTLGHIGDSVRNSIAYPLHKRYYSVVVITKTKSFLKRSTKTISFDKLINWTRPVYYKEKNHKIGDRNGKVFRLLRDSHTYEVKIDSDLKINDYRRITLPEDWELLEKLAKRIAGKSVVFINPTMEGGGVAMMRPPLVHLLKMFGVDAHWYVMADKKNSNDPSPFVFTKLMHNILQRRTLPNVRITEEGKIVHKNWNKENAKVLTAQKIIREADIIVLDDPQPAPLKQYINKVNPNVRWVWRSHIDTSGELMSNHSTPQGGVASYLLDDCGLRWVDAVITHPVDAFITPDLYDKTFFAPATIDPYDDLNRPLTEHEIKVGIDNINSEIIKKNKELKLEKRHDDVQSLVDSNRRQIVLIARFDESKGMDKAIKLGVHVRRKMRELKIIGKDLPQIIVIGNGSVDDPSGESMYEKVLRIRRDFYQIDKEDIIIMRLKHNYLAINALMSQKTNHLGNTLTQLIALQTSEAEGFETRISDWIRHGVPVVVSNRGGMPLQIIEGQSGLILDFDKPNYDIERGANFICCLMTDYKKYTKFRNGTLKQAQNYNNREFTTTANAARLLRVFFYTLFKLKPDKAWRVDDIRKAINNPKNF